MASVEIPNDWMPLFEWRKRFYSKQVDFINSLEKYWECLFVAGNGTGKSLTFYWNLICLALGIHPHQIAKPPIRIKILIIDFEHGYGKIFKETCLDKQYLHDGTVIGPMLPRSAIKKYPSRDDRTLYLKNDSTLFFQTSEQKKRLHSGTTFDILGCDEEPDYQIYDESKRGLRTAKGGGKILHAMTPPFDEEERQKGPSWTKFKLVDVFERGEDPDLSVVRAAMIENPAITPEYIRKFSKGKSEEQLRIQLYGEYPTWGKMIFPTYQDYMWDSKVKQGHLLPHDFEVPFRDRDVKFEFAIDWHASKPTAAIWTFEYLSGPNKGDVVVWDEISPKMSKNKTIYEIAQIIREVEGWDQLKIRRYGDPKMKDKNNALITGFSAWQEFRHCGIYLSEGWNRQPETGISITNDFFKGKGKDNPDHPRVFIKENCSTVRYQVKNHYWVKRDGSPDPKFSDYPICLRYILQSKSRKIKKNMEKSGKSKWDLTSYGGNPFGPYEGTYIDPKTLRI